jgi:hypothetical protein
VSAQPSLELDCDCAAHERIRIALQDASALPREARCPACGKVHALHPERLSDDIGGGGLVGCLACGHPELYRQKDFSRALGLVIVVTAAVLAPFTYYLSLAAAALADCALYLVAPERVVCYVCGARHRGFAREPRHPKFDREIAERLAYGERAVMGKPMRPGGTAGAPEPEH